MTDHKHTKVYKMCQRLTDDMRAPPVWCEVCRERGQRPCEAERTVENQSQSRLFETQTTCSAIVEICV